MPWRSLSDSSERTATALRALYKHYRAHEPELWPIVRFSPFIQAVPKASTEIRVRGVAGETALLECVIRAKFTGTLPTPEGNVQGRGQHIDLPYVHQVKVEAGKVSEMKLYYDSVTFFRQLGLVPERAAA